MTTNERKLVVIVSVSQRTKSHPNRCKDSGARLADATSRRTMLLYRLDGTAVQELHSK